MKLLWLLVVRRAFDTDNCAAIIKLLRSDCGMPTQARRMLAAALETRSLKKKRGGQRSLFRATAEQRIAQMADTVKKLQTGETRLMWEPTSEEIQAMGMSVDEKSAAILDQEAQRMRKLRSPNGLMKRDNAIDLVAGIHGIKRT